ncbi:hypothetical protein BKA58DRAFT_453073, partial [Alternaria rosae]|uniref:uncharacterized protein n=1 Tax=Alternaria rosae TaxID=1187941 RepID=UPI001E8D6714
CFSTLCSIYLSALLRFCPSPRGTEVAHSGPHLPWSSNSTCSTYVRSFSNLPTHIYGIILTLRSRTNLLFCCPHRFTCNFSLVQSLRSGDGAAHISRPLSLSPAANGTLRVEIALTYIHSTGKLRVSMPRPPPDNTNVATAPPPVDDVLTHTPTRPRSKSIPSRRDTAHRIHSLNKATTPSTTMAPVSYPSSTRPATPAPYPLTRSALKASSFQPLSPAAIGLICGVGIFGILIYIICAILYFRSKPISLWGLMHKGTHTDEENGADGRNGVISMWERDVPLYDRSGITTTANSAFGDTYSSGGIAVNAGLEREILEILKAQAEVRAMSRVVGRY